MNPGRVASTLEDAPPGRGACSQTVTSSPARARLIAHTRPVEPAPITTTRLSRVMPCRDGSSVRRYPQHDVLNLRRNQPPPTAPDLRRVVQERAARSASESTRLPRLTGSHATRTASPEA